MLILPLAFYGSEVAPPAVDLVSQLSSAIASGLAPHNKSTCNAITFLTTTKHACEPGAYMLQSKCKLFRRIVAKHPWLALFARTSLAAMPEGASRVPSPLEPRFLPWPTSLPMALALAAPQRARPMALLDPWAVRALPCPSSEPPCALTSLALFTPTSLSTSFTFPTSTSS